MHKIRKQALKAGDKYYFTGKPCKHGHVELRHAVSGICCECCQVNKKAWQDRNIEKMRAYWRDYYKRKKSKKSC